MEVMPRIRLPRGKVLDYRVPILVGQVRVNPGDIIFGDIDGVLAIPQAQEKKSSSGLMKKPLGKRLWGGHQGGHVR